MKKIAILCILIYLVLPQKIFAADSSNSCKLTEGTPEVITNFITNQRILVNNISDVLYKTEPKKSISADISNLKAKIFDRSAGVLFNWDNYYSYFNFYVTYPIQNETVYEIRRDYDLLEQETSGLQSYYKYVVSNGYADVNLSKDDICKGVENCDFSGNVVNVIGKIKGNLEYLKNYYRVQITGKNDRTSIESKNFKITDLKLVGKDFETDFTKYYNTSTTSDCSNSEGGFMDRIAKSANKIIDYQKSYKDGIQEWKEAIELLSGESSNYQEVERELLAQELSNQGIGGSQADTILRNLDTYNKNGISSQLKNNFITNSFSYIVGNIGSQINEFDQNVLTGFGSGQTQTSITNFGKNTISTIEDNEINANIEYLYKSELPYAQMTDKTAIYFISKLIDMHNNLNASIKVLESLKDISQKVCNSQAFGIGRCEY